MPEKHTIENWGDRLNIKGEEIEIAPAMLLSLGHLNARLEILIVHLSDMRSRLTRLEMFVEDTVPGYAAHAERMRKQEEKQRKREQRSLKEAS